MLRTPKGTFDLGPQESKTIDEIVEKVKSVYETHGGVPITTPMFELRDILMNKYGDDTKLIYNLEDQGGDICSLRYDLTVPFSRYLCTNQIRRIRRYQIGSVFRRDNPSIRTGRRREFIQADFDMCGACIPMLYDSEAVKMIYDILSLFNLPYPIKIKVNDRRILVGLLKMCRVPENLQQTVCSTVDKAGKLTAQEFTEELSVKGLEASMIADISSLIINNNNENALEFLKTLDGSEEFKQGISDMATLFTYLEIYKVPGVVLDLSLARGLDYYTGLIMEAVYEGSEVGSVAGGGRYDNLCDSLSEGRFNTPCVGFSIGVTRLFALCQPKPLEFDVFIGSGFGLNIEERMNMMGVAWSLGLRTETFPGKRVNYQEQLAYATENGFRVAVFTGNNEIEKGIYFAVDLKTKQKIEIQKSELRTYLENLK